LPFGKGQWFPSEHCELRDEQTGTVVHRLTSQASVNHHLYFLNRSFTPDGKTVVFTSYRDGRANLYELAFPDGPLRQLTEGEGLHPFSACLSHSGTEIFFTREGSVYRLHRENLEEVCLARFSKAQLGECNLSGNGRWLVTAIRQDGHAGIAVIRTDGRESGVLLRWPKTVIHPQFHPLNDNVIEFDGLKVYVDAMSGMYLDGVKIDYIESLEGSGFKIENPNATGSCGCGHSFQA